MSGKRSDAAQKSRTFCYKAVCNPRAVVLCGCAKVSYVAGSDKKNRCEEIGMSEPQHPTPFGGQSVGHADGRGENLASATTAVSSATLDSVAAVGARLAMLREGKNWSIDDISARLKVSPLKLRALESGDLSLFPDRNFAAGIVRSYAKIMGADPAPFTLALRNANGPLEQNLSLPASSGAGLPRGRVSVPLGGPPKRRSWLWGLAAVIVAVIALAMWHTGGDSAVWLARLKASASGAPSSTAGNEASPASSVPTPDENAAAGVGGTSAGSSVEVANAASGATDSAGAAQPMPHPLGTDALPSTSSAIAGAQGASGTNAKSLAATPPAAALAQASGTAATAGTGPNAIELKVNADSWFSVREKGGKEVFSGLVHAGSVQRVEGDAPFKVTVGNRAGLESLTFDGQPVEPAKFGPAKGNVARFSLP
jgi:cytoskeleton protein RodZ